MVGWHIDSVNLNLSKLQEMVKDREQACCSPWGYKELDMTEQMNNKCKLSYRVAHLCMHICISDV